MNKIRALTGKTLHIKLQIVAMLIVVVAVVVNCLALSLLAVFAGCSLCCFNVYG